MNPILINTSYLILLFLFTHYIVTLITKVKDEFDYVSVIIERYETKLIQYGPSSPSMENIKKNNGIQLKFHYVIETESLLYLFDRSKVFFAVYNKKTKTTHLQNLKTFKKLVCEMEGECEEKTLPGDITMLPNQYTQPI